MASITSIKNKVDLLALKLSRFGFTTEIEVVKSRNIQYIELSIELNNNLDIFCFVADNQYFSGRHRYCGEMPDMMKRFNYDFEKIYKHKII